MLNYKDERKEGDNENRMKNHILLIDGMAILFRAFHATAYRNYFMLNSKGMPTNGLHGFIRHLAAAVDHFEPTHVAACWDMGSKTFRSEMLDTYKGNREAPPVELIPQFEAVKQVAAGYGIPNIGLKNYEADDCIGTLASLYAAEGHQVTVLTGDQDMLQLVRPNIDVAIMRKGEGNYEIFQETSFFEQKGLTPAQIIDMKGLMGDSSDNYPGVKGIGEKTAIKLLTQYENIDKLLENLEELPAGVRKKIESDLDNLHLSRKLAAIHCKVPISCELEDAVWAVDEKQKQAMLEEFELTKLSRLLRAADQLAN